MKNRVALGALALAVGTLLNMIRMAPIFLSDGFSFDEFPPNPEDAAEVAKTALLGGWYVSHVFAIVSVPFIVFGFYSIYRSRTRGDDSVATTVTLAGVFGIATSAMLYLIAAVLDGVALGKAAHVYRDSTGTKQESAGVVLTGIHETAASFGGHFMAGALISTGIFALGLALANRTSIFPKLGIAFGTIGIIGTVSGILDLSFQERFPLLGGLVGLMMMWWLALSIMTIRGAKAGLNEEERVDASVTA